MMPHEWPFDQQFTKYSDEELYTIVHSKELYGYDRGDLVNLVEELAKRLHAPKKRKGW
jgi:hypothetical protein